jgi:hypothetical protein
MQAELSESSWEKYFLSLSPLKKDLASTPEILEIKKHFFKIMRRWFSE